MGLIDAGFRGSYRWTGWPRDGHAGCRWGLVRAGPADASESSREVVSTPLFRVLIIEGRPRKFNPRDAHVSSFTHLESIFTKMRGEPRCPPPPICPRSGCESGASIRPPSPRDSRDSKSSPASGENWPTPQRSVRFLLRNGSMLRIEIVTRPTSGYRWTRCQSRQQIFFRSPHDALKPLAHRSTLR